MEGDRFPKPYNSSFGIYSHVGHLYSNESQRSASTAKAFSGISCSTYFMSISLNFTSLFCRKCTLRQVDDEWTRKETWKKSRILTFPSWSTTLTKCTATLVSETEKWFASSLWHQTGIEGSKLSFSSVPSATMPYAVCTTQGYFNSKTNQIHFNATFVISFTG